MLDGEVMLQRIIINIFKTNVHAIVKGAVAENNSGFNQIMEGIVKGCYDKYTMR